MSDAACGHRDSAAHIGFLVVQRRIPRTHHSSGRWKHRGQQRDQHHLGRKRCGRGHISLGQIRHNRKFQMAVRDDHQRRPDRNGET